MHIAKPFFLLAFFILNFSCTRSYGQKNILSVGPTLTVSNNDISDKGRKGWGAGVSYYHRFFSHSGLRLQVGVEEFHTPGRSNDQVQYVSARAGYQHFILKSKLMLWGDAGMATLEFPLGQQYQLFTFSTGGGYHIPLGSKSAILLEGSYVWTEDKDIFTKEHSYGWFTFRVAYGISFGK